ncbi:MAG: hypothetical protein ACRDLD_13460 [Thermoleophilaceae bacterium]
MPYHECARIYRTWPLTALIAAGETLDEQAQALASWARESFVLALEHGSGEGFEAPSRNAEASATGARARWETRAKA